jgi:hypothetical protein
MFGPVSYLSVTRSTQPELIFSPSIIKLTLTARCSLLSPFYAQPLSTTGLHMCPGIRPLLLPILLLETDCRTLFEYCNVRRWRQTHLVYSRSRSGCWPSFKKASDLPHLMSSTFHSAVSLGLGRRINIAHRLRICLCTCRGRRQGQPRGSPG